MRILSLLPALGVAACGIVLPLLGGAARAAEAPTLDPKGVEYFEKNIRPVLVEKCYPCHSMATKAKGGLLLDTRENTKRGGGSGPVIVPGKPEESLLYKAMTFTNPDLQMPPAGKLSEAQLAAFKAWIAMGAPDPREDKDAKVAGNVLSGLTPKARSHWSFQPLKKVNLPAGSPDPELQEWNKNPVDRFVLARLNTIQVRPSQAAARETLIRRVSYDLVGLPPTPMEVKAFVNDRSPDAYERLVDRLLASPRYGERWGRHWLDSARYSDTHGNRGDGGGRLRYEDYRFPYAWTYRDYVIKAINEDKPYNQFLVEQIAVDRLPDVKEDDPRLSALGFLTVGRRFDNNDDTIDERIDTVTKATMGLTVSCARCHDHKFDPIPTADYYALHGVFSSTNEPYDRPTLPHEVEQNDKVQFSMRLTQLEDRNRAAIQNLIRDLNTRFQDKAGAYLRIATLPGRAQERLDLSKRFNINSDREREMFGGLRINPNHPVFGPFAQLARLAPEDFAQRASEAMPKILDAKKGVNPLVAAALKDLKPQSISDVADAYTALFANAKAEAKKFYDARATAGLKTVPVDDAMAQLIQMPFYVPPADAIATVEQQTKFFSLREGVTEGWQTVLAPDESAGRLLFSAINELRLTEKGAPPKPMLIKDNAKPQDSFVFIRGERFRRGPVVPRQFLEVVSGPGRTPFKEGSGRLELAKAIVDPKNPLTARVLVNRVWMYHFGEGFVRSPDDLGNMSEAPSNQELLDYLSAWFMDNGWSLKKLNKLIVMSQTYQQASESRFEGEERDPDNRMLWRGNTRRLDFEAIRDSLLSLTGKMDTAMGGAPVNITEEPYSYRRSVYGYIDRAELSDLLSQFDVSNPEVANTKRISTIVPQQALFFMNNALPIEVARQVMSRRDVVNAVDDVARVEAVYSAIFQRKPKPEEVELAATFIGKAMKRVQTQISQGIKPGLPDTSSVAGAKAGNGKKPPALASNKPMGGMPMTAMGGMDMMGGMNDMGDRRSKGVTIGKDGEMKMGEMGQNRFAPPKNGGETVDRRPLTPWEQYVQALLFSNEFVYVS